MRCKSAIAVWEHAIIIQKIAQLFVFKKVEFMKSILLDEHIAAHVAELFSAFSDTSRVRIISAMIGQEVTISQLTELIGLTESAISHHLRGLRQLKIVRARRKGKQVFYQINDPHLISLFQQGIDHVTE